MPKNPRSQKGRCYRQKEAGRAVWRLIDDGAWGDGGHPDRGVDPGVRGRRMGRPHDSNWNDIQEYPALVATSLGRLGDLPIPQFVELAVCRACGVLSLSKDRNIETNPVATATFAPTPGPSTSSGTFPPSPLSSLRLSKRTPLPPRPSPPTPGPSTGSGTCPASPLSSLRLSKRTPLPPQPSLSPPALRQAQGPSPPPPKFVELVETNPAATATFAPIPGPSTFRNGCGSSYPSSPNENTHLSKVGVGSSIDRARGRN